MMLEQLLNQPTNRQPDLFLCPSSPLFPSVIFRLFFYDSRSFAPHMSLSLSLNCCDIFVKYRWVSANTSTKQQRLKNEEKKLHSRSRRCDEEQNKEKAEEDKMQT
jgi:hypothetical protein